MSASTLQIQNHISGTEWNDFAEILFEDEIEIESPFGDEHCISNDEEEEEEQQESWQNKTTCHNTPVDKYAPSSLSITPIKSLSLSHPPPTHIKHLLTHPGRVTDTPSILALNILIATVGPVKEACLQAQGQLEADLRDYQVFVEEARRSDGGGGRRERVRRGWKRVMKVGRRW